MMIKQKTSAKKTQLEPEVTPQFKLITASFNRLRSDTERDNFCSAVQDSFRLDTTGAQIPKPTTPQGISDNWGFTIKAQRQYGLILNKTNGIEFLISIGIPTVNTSLYKEDIPQKFNAVFETKPDRIYQNQPLYTFAQWLHIVDYEFEVPLPLTIRRHLFGDPGDLSEDNDDN